MHYDQATKDYVAKRTIKDGTKRRSSAASKGTSPARSTEPSAAPTPVGTSIGWTKTFTDPRLCAAIVDRLTFGGNIIETGTDSYRLAHSRNQQAAG
jgi:hypothetical protein